MLLLLWLACGDSAKGGADGGVFVDPFDRDCPAISPFACDATDIADKLKCISGISATEVADSGVPGLRRFLIDVTQPIDHGDPSGASFSQRVMLWHRNETAPLVLYTSGYGLSRTVTEPTQLLGANQLSYEHRFFGPSTPSDPTFQTLTVAQAANDAHRLSQLFRPIYRSRWLNTGGSKGGMASVFHRKNFPCDVDATVAYVAPVIEGTDDQAHNAFLKTVGGDAYAFCRADIVKAQRAALTRRDELIPLMPDNVTFNTFTKARAFEFTVIDSNFGFWQYTLPSSKTNGCQTIPKPDASAEALAAFIDRHGSFLNNSDQDLEDYRGFWVAAAKELGYAGPFEEPVSDLLQFQGTYDSAAYARGTYSYNPQTQREVTAWAAREARRMLYIYGALDPWSARMYDANEANEAYRLVVEGRNHQARIADMPAEQQQIAVSALERWMGVRHMKLPGIEKPAGSLFLETPTSSRRHPLGRSSDDE
jgi:PS-10 peptidase S37